MNKNSKKSEGNIYDRIFKENAEQLFIPLIEMQLKKKIISYKRLSEKLPRTIERETDSLYLIELENGKEELLHLEFQSQDDRLMIYRMGVYHGLALAKYFKPISNVVIYLGSGKSKMRNHLLPEEIFSGFELISINTIDSKELIQSQIPEILILGVLGKYQKEHTEQILSSILKKLKKLSKSRKDLEKFQQQLIILSRLRKLEKETIKILDAMPIEYDIEKDYLYQQGETIGLEKGESIGLVKGESIGIEKAGQIIDLYKKGNSATQISKFTGISLIAIEKIISKL